ncbi:MAG: hypothetical protein M3Y72_07825 [Acidobacteriota bacterium]|nr:hypothetical protein [Acidobacteriota bacterium]MDQ2840930.1 hypothetical protein [Acidobacteriota bacterium]
MQRQLGLIGILVTCAASLGAQNQDEGHWPVTLGLKAGIPVTDMFTSGNSGFSGTNLITNTTSYGSAYSSSNPRYEFGASAEFHAPFHLRFEVDGLFKPGRFDSNIGSASGLTTSHTSFNQWEIPGVFKYNVSLGHFRPFLDFGASYRHISTIDQRTYLAAVAPSFNDNAREIRNRNSFGGVAGFGITFKKGPFELTPEARYTRWG